MPARQKFSAYISVVKKMDKFHPEFNVYKNARYSVYSIGFYYQAPLLECLPFETLAEQVADIIPQEYNEFLPGIAILAYDHNHGGAGKAQFHFNDDNKVPYVCHFSNPDRSYFNYGVTVLANVIVSICISITCAHLRSIT